MSHRQRDAEVAHEMLEEIPQGVLMGFERDGTPDTVMGYVRDLIVLWCGAHDDAADVLTLQGESRSAKGVSTLVQNNAAALREVVALAVIHRLRCSRIAIAKSELRRLQVKYDIHDADVQALCDFPDDAPRRVRGKYDITDEDAIARLSDAPRILEREGQHLRIIGAGMQQTADGQTVYVQTSFHAYLQQAEGDTWVITVPDVPSLYADGKSPDEAASALLILMAGWHRDLSANPEARVGGDVARLRQFLEKVLGAGAEPA